jgi:acetylornithine deacetylase
VNLKEWRLNDERFLRVLGAMMAHGERLQNSPLQDAPPPQEDLAGNVVREALAPFVRGGQLLIEHVSYVENRGNLILTYPGRTDRTVAFVGAHLDVVPADPKEWRRPPFELQVEGDRLYGRGVTDCLGHVAVLTDLFAQLAEKRVTLDRTVVAVIIANEELSNTHGVGIHRLVKEGKLAHLQNGPVYWIDSADFGPTIGTGGMAVWRLVVEGKSAHSGFPQNGINAAELAFLAVQKLQEWFYRNYPPHPKEKEYGFLAPSSLKPTRVQVENDTLTKIPARAIIEGDIRLTPWYSPEEVKAGALAFINNLDVRELPILGPSRYALGEAIGTVKFEAIGAPSGGVACDRLSPGYLALADAIAAVRSEARPFALTGTLPYVRFLQRHGFDVQITGFGRMDAYHAPNEFAEMSHMRDGFRILCHILAQLG